MVGNASGPHLHNWSPSAGFRRRTAFPVSRMDPGHGRDAARAFGGGRHDARIRRGRACRRRGVHRNRIKASLRAFQRREVKVLGFGMKARPRPQRMALRWCYDPFGLVGANGKACGEAPRVFFPGPPPGVLGCVFLVVVVCWRGWCVGGVGVLAWLVCALAVWLVGVVCVSFVFVC